jgi:hypothetical protein
MDNPRRYDLLPNAPAQELGDLQGLSCLFGSIVDQIGDRQAIVFNEFLSIEAMYIIESTDFAFDNFVDDMGGLVFDLAFGDLFLMREDICRDFVWREVLGRGSGDVHGDLFRKVFFRRTSSNFDQGDDLSAVV